MLQKAVDCTLTISSDLELLVDLKVYLQWKVTKLIKEMAIAQNITRVRKIDRTKEKYFDRTILVDGRVTDKHGTR